MGFDYDASDAQMDNLQRELDKAGVTKEEFDLSNLCGATYREMKHTVDAVLAWKAKKEAAKKNGTN